MKTAKLGDLAKDKVTGYTGIVMAITNWITGCARVTLQAQVLKDGKAIDILTVDETLVEVLEENKIPSVNRGVIDAPVVATPEEQEVMELRARLAQAESKLSRKLSRKGGPAPEPTHEANPTE